MHSLRWIVSPGLSAMAFCAIAPLFLHRDASDGFVSTR
jgi:hypothetical protein